MLWKQVAESTTPLSQKRGQILHEEMEKLLNATVPQTNNVPRLTKPVVQKNPQHVLASAPKQRFTNSHPIEKSTLKKLGRGNRVVDARIDLHGMTQDRARFALLDFLQMSQHAGHRIVLVITGKGNDGRGVLKQNVPRWLSLPGFTQLVNGYEQAHGHQGGEGALYVRLRRLSRRGQ